MSLNIYKRYVKDFSVFYASSWITRNTTAQNWTGVCFGAGLFVAVSSGGTNRVITSTDAISDWTLRTTPLQSWRNVIFRGEISPLFVAVADGGTSTSIMTSPDGITWTGRTTPGSGVVAWTSVVWAGGTVNLFVAVGSGTGTNKVMTSPDGVTWTQRTCPDEAWTNITWSPELGRLVAVAIGSSGNRVMYSSDGINWTSGSSSSSSFGFYSVIWSSLFRRFYAVGDSSNVQVSEDGITFSTILGIPSFTFRDICVSNELGLIVCSGLTDTGMVITQSPGTTWNYIRTIINAITVSKIIWEPTRGVFVGVGSAYIITTKELGIGWGK